jgi:two-component system nitrogen regulation sensor histidine kinase NtrY
MTEKIEGMPPLDSRERRKRKREIIAIALLVILFVVLTLAEFRLTKLSSTLPFVNSIFFFGLLNINIIILITLMWLVFRNVGKVFLERRRNVLGSRLKTKLVAAFLSLSIIPTLVLFVISALYINSSFDKWFSLRVQNTLQASLEITSIYYRNTEQTAMHFAEHLAKGIGERMRGGPATSYEASALASFPQWMEGYLGSERELLALDAVEFYADPLDERVIAQKMPGNELTEAYPRLPLDLLNRAFAGERVPVLQHVGSGALIRCLVPIHAPAAPGSGSSRAAGGENAVAEPILGVIAVNSYIPVSLVNKVDEVASVLDDLKDTNPLKYPIKRTYLIILIMITLMVMLVAVWIGLYMARELTVPVERLVYGAKAVGAGNLDLMITASGHDEISVLVDSFNKMTRDLKENRERLTQAGADLERRRLQLEAVLANIGTGVIAVDSRGEITTFNRAVAKILQIGTEDALHRGYEAVLTGEAEPLARVIRRAFSLEGDPAGSGIEQWNFRAGEQIRVLAAVATSLRDSDVNWGVVVVIDDLTHLIKGQREMAWREVARRIAHEIKNPLTPIKLSAQRLQRKGTRSDEAFILECTDTIIKHTDELKEMVNEFSNFARFPEISPAPHDLNLAISEVVALYQQGHPEFGFKVQLERKLPIFEFDRDQIKRIVINLFDNAIAALRNDPTERHPEVQVSSHYNEPLQMAVFEVADNGPGMTEETRARVFEPYFSTKAGGTGLGLAIAKRIVNDHDGFIRVHSSPGEGTRFLIELPTAVRGAAVTKQDRET